MRCAALAFALLPWTSLALAQSPGDTAAAVSFSAYVDPYYAFDFDEPKNLDRAFTTQAARHNEFNINLAFIDAKVTAPRLRGRLALQAGTSVQSNYSGEPAVGSVSGGSLARHIQEATAGFRVTPSLWLDGGIFFAHIGMESFISRDNLTYTRSLSAEFTPYYETGAKLTWQTAPRLTALLAVVNGWQNISENNRDKAAGLRLDYTATAATTVSYYNFIGKENPSRNLRIFNGVGLKTTVARNITLQANADYGMQDKEQGGRSKWYSAGVVAKFQPTSRIGISGRAEEFRDSDQVIIVTGTNNGFKGTTASVGVDVLPIGSNRAMWRNEVRGTWTTDPVFPRRSGDTMSRNNYLLVTSFGLTF